VSGEKILIVEDDAIIAMRLQDTLDNWGYGTAIIPSGEQALEWIDQSHPDLVLMDIRLDGKMDGIQAAEQIRANLGPPTIFLTAYSDEELIERAKLTEPYGYLVKPVQERELRSTMEMALFKHRMDEKLRRRVAELEAVNRISSALRSAEELSQMLPVLLDEILLILDAQDGLIALNLPASSDLEILEARGWLRDTDGLFNGSGKGLLKSVLSHPVPYYGRDFSKVKGLEPEIRECFPKGWGGAILPIQAVNEVLGLILVSVAAPRILSDSETRLLEIVAEIAGSSIHRMRLHGQTQRNLQRIAALHEIDTIIRSNLDLGVTLGVILEHVVQQLSVDAANVYLLDARSPYLQQTAGRGFKTWTSEHLRVRVGEGLVGRSALERQRVVGGSADFDQEVGERARMFREERIKQSYSVPLLSRGKVIGVLEVFSRTQFEPEKEWLDFLGNLAGQAALAVEDLRLLESLHHSNAELTLAYDETIEGWSRAMDLRDRETEGHTRRVTELTLELAQRMGLPDELIVHVRRGVMLHDVGKIGVPDNILHKPGPLTDPEMEIMRRHPRLAYELIAPIAYLQPALDIPYCHHEKWDGTGYPRGLKGDQIPLAARLFAAVDVYDALTSDRPYRRRWAKQKAISYILEQSGRHFDPQIVEVFVKLIEK
jgi:response regulator RpfG family c-di-GMP phosphodiesterase